MKGDELMPRGVKGSCSYAQQLQKIDEKIQRYTEHLASLREQRQELLNRQREADMKELHEYMTEHDLTSRDLIDWLTLEKSPCAARLEKSDTLQG